MGAADELRGASVPRRALLLKRVAARRREDLRLGQLEDIANSEQITLAIEAYLGAYTLPAPEQPEKRLRDWFAAVERYPRQLHEMGRDEYLSMKRRELARQQAASVEAN